jgi:molybdopterin/thiamine biosynthesis adenylyltransferase/nitroreductase
VTDPDDLACAARVLDERNPQERSVVDALAQGSTAMIDLYRRQLAELRGLVAVPEDMFTEPPRWVHFPWRDSAVRVLGPRGYRRLRLDRNRNKITAAEQDAYARLRIGVVGASVGHLVALGLALEGLFGLLRITDFDTVELNNLNRLPGSVLDYGLNKTVVLARRIAEIDPYAVVEADTAGLDPARIPAFLDGLDLVIEVCDSLDVKLALREQAARLRIPVLMVTSDRGTVDVERFDREPTRPPFHGLADGLTSDLLANLPSEAKVPYVLNMVGADGLSPRMAASMLEIGESLTTWPHLAGDAMQAAACAVMAVRRLAGAGELPSGRVHVDIAQRLDELAEPALVAPLPSFAPVGPYRNLPEPQSDELAVARAAQLAPSGGNVQPWRITVAPSTVRLALDPAVTTAMDVAYRGSLVAVGAALLNMRIEAAHRGLLGPCEVSADDSAAAVATLRLAPGRDEALARLREPMLRRVTNRNLGDPDRRVPPEQLAELAGAAEAEGGEPAVITDPAALSEAAELLADADRIRFLRPRLHREMIAELRDPRTDPLDRGLDVRTLEMGPGTVMLGLVGRDEVVGELEQWDALADAPVGRGLGGRIGRLVGSSSALIAVTIDDPVDGSGAAYLRGGAAMQRVWIAATAAGLAVQPIVPLYLYARTDPELHELAGPYVERLATARQRLRELFGLDSRRSFAMVLRLSFASAPSAISLRSAETIVVDGIDADDRSRYGQSKANGDATA